MRVNATIIISVKVALAVQLRFIQKQWCTWEKLGTPSHADVDQSRDLTSSLFSFNVIDPNRTTCWPDLLHQTLRVYTNRQPHDMAR